jgi:spore coat polysaccharide biosynthesis protein SpsF
MLNGTGTCSGHNRCRESGRSRWAKSPCLMLSIAIIQARFSSKRLPGKILFDLLGKTMLQRVVERVRMSTNVSDVIVATSIGSDDDQVEQECRRLDVKLSRGPLENVAERFRIVLEEHNAPCFVRISADSPLIDPALINRALAIFETHAPDLATNTCPYTFPRGMSVEVVDTACFLRTLPEIKESLDLEHVTRFFYRNRDRFRISNFTSQEGDFSHIKLCVDTNEDLARVTRVLQLLDPGSRHYSWRDLVALIDGDK